MPVELPAYEEKGGWVAQLKINGTRTLIHIQPNGEVEVVRPGTTHKFWELTDNVKDQILSLNIERGKEYWLDGELLNNKTKTPFYRNRIVLYDVLQAGRFFFGRPKLLERQEILLDICGNPDTLEPENGLALQATDNIWVLETFYGDFVEHYKAKIHLDEVEGLMLKKINSFLKNFGHKEHEVTWQLRCRKEHKNYQF
jgi:hypothetical protein